MIGHGYTDIHLKKINNYYVIYRFNYNLTKVYWTYNAYWSKNIKKADQYFTKSEAKSVVSELSQRIYKIHINEFITEKEFNV